MQADNIEKLKHFIQTTRAVFKPVGVATAPVRALRRVLGGKVVRQAGRRNLVAAASSPTLSAKLVSFWTSAGGAAGM